MVEKYNYEDLNRQYNKDAEVHVEEIDFEDREFARSRGISHNLKDALIEESGYESKHATNVMFELLHSIDEEVKAQKISSGVDDLESWITNEGVDNFSITGGYIYFEAGEEEVLKIPAISSRQAELKGEFYKKKEEVIEEAVVEREQIVEEIKGPPPAPLEAPDDSMAVKIALPPRERTPDKFVMPRSFWIENEEPPHVIAGRHRHQIVCMGYVGEMLRRDTGNSNNLRAMGFKERHDAWQFKSDLMKEENVAVAGSMQHYLYISRNGNIGRRRSVGSSKYRKDMMTFRDSLSEGVEREGDNGNPFVMTLRYKYSDYQREAARVNSRLPKEQRSLNTHIVYCLGKGRRKLPGVPGRNEGLTDFTIRSLRIDRNEKYLLEGLTVWVDDIPYDYYNGMFRNQNTGGGIKINASSNVELEDLYFSHKFGNSRVESFTQLIASGKYDPVDMLEVKINGVIEENKDKVLPIPNKLPEVPIVSCMYLRRGDTVYGRFKREVSTNDTEWEMYRVYLEEIGFDPSSVKVQIEPIPVPNMDSLAEYIDSRGGLEGIRVEKIRARVEKFNEAHSDEYLFMIEPGDNPWNKIKHLFEDKGAGGYSQEERTYILSEIDALNRSVDLRLDPMKKYHHGRVDYAKFNVGSYFWVSDEIIERLIENTRYFRLKQQVSVPETISVMRYPNKIERAAGKKPELVDVEITQEERDAIESATTDPQLRMTLTMILLNEQKGGRWRHRGARIAAHLGRKEGSLGMFQVPVRKEDWEYYGYEKEGEYRKRLRQDPHFNAQVAIRQIKENTGVLNDFLRLNGDTPDKYGMEYMSAALTLYNRSPKKVYSGLIGQMGERISKKYDLGLDFIEYELQFNPELYEEDPTEETEDYQFKGFRLADTSDYWRDLAHSLSDQGILVGLPPEEIESDTELMIRNIPAFLESRTYKTIKHLYESDGEQLTMLIQKDEFDKVAVVNYGYKALRYDQVSEVIAYSTEVNEAEARAKDIRFADLSDLPSVRKRQGLPAEDDLIATAEMIEDNLS